jgi:hypothetical protein
LVDDSPLTAISPQPCIACAAPFQMSSDRFRISQIENIARSMLPPAVTVADLETKEGGRVTASGFDPICQSVSAH